MITEAYYFRLALNFFKLSICSSVSLSAFPLLFIAASLPLSFSICLSISICLSFPPPLCLSVCPNQTLVFKPSKTCKSPIFKPPTLTLFCSLSLCLSVCLCLCLSVSVSLSFSRTTFLTFPPLFPLSIHFLSPIPFETLLIRDKNFSPPLAPPPPHTHTRRNLSFLSLFIFLFSSICWSVKRSAQSTFALRPIPVIKSRPPTTAQFVVRKSWDYLNGVLCFTLSGAHSLAAAQIATGLDLAGVRADVTPRLQHVSFVNTPWCTRMMHSRKSKTFIQSL